MSVLETIRRSLLPTLTFGALLWSAPASAQAIDFESLGYNSATNGAYLAGSTTQWNSHNCSWDGQNIAAGYGQTNWSGFKALDLQDYLYSDGQQHRGRCFVNGRSGSMYNITADQYYTGYRQQLEAGPAVTGTNVLAVSGGTSAGFSRSSMFQLQSMEVGGGWGNVASMRVSGWANGLEIWSRAFSFLGTSGNFATINDVFGSINEVRFAVTYSEDDPFNTKGELTGYGYTNPSAYRTFWADDITFQVSTVPEPGTWALMAFGLVGVGVSARRRRKS